MKLLIVEDEINMLNGLRDNLEFEGYEVDTASAGNEGLSKVLNNQYNLIILDVMLPEISGFDICKKARESKITTPIIMLTAKSEEIDKVLGLEFGADDYMTKPFSLRELIARIKAILRRVPTSEGTNSSTDEVTLGKVNVNFKTFQCTDLAGNEVKMSAKEVDIIRYLYEHKNETVDRHDLMSKVWGIEYDITTRTVDNFILRIRQKLEEDSNKPRIIITVHGIGYKLVF